MNPTTCICPDRRIIEARTPRKLLQLIERDVASRTETQLRGALVTDAVKRIATDLRWAVAAYEEIGRRSGKGAEQAYRDVLDEVEALTGLRMMPV